MTVETPSTHTPGAGSTGPTSEAGKEASSRNALNHGARAQKHFILHGESIHEYNSVLITYGDEFQPANEAEFDLVQRIAEARWRLLRCERLADRTFEEALMNHPDPFSWTPELHKSIANFKKYATMAERTFRSAIKDLVDLRKNRLAHERALQQSLERQLPVEPEPDEDEDNRSIEEIMAENEKLMAEDDAFNKEFGDYFKKFGLELKSIPR